MKGNKTMQTVAAAHRAQSTDAIDFSKICPKFEHAFLILGKRWNGLIIRILLNGPLRFSAIEDAIPSLSARMLSERCRELEQEGLIHRHVYPEKPVRIEYELTDKGRDLEAALEMIQQWSNKWCED